MRCCLCHCLLKESALGGGVGRKVSQAEVQPAERTASGPAQGEIGGIQPYIPHPPGLSLFTQLCTRFLVQGTVGRPAPSVSTPPQTHTCPSFSVVAPDPTGKPSEKELICDPRPCSTST